MPAETPETDFQGLEPVPREMGITIGAPVFEEYQLTTRPLPNAAPRTGRVPRRENTLTRVGTTVPQGLPQPDRFRTREIPVGEWEHLLDNAERVPMIEAAPAETFDYFGDTTLHPRQPRWLGRETAGITEEVAQPEDHLHIISHPKSGICIFDSEASCILFWGTTFTEIEQFLKRRQIQSKAIAQLFKEKNLDYNWESAKQAMLDVYGEGEASALLKQIEQ